MTNNMQPLIHALHKQYSDSHTILWLADENVSPDNINACRFAQQNMTVLCNRYDIHTHFIEQNYHSIFCDFEFGMLNDKKFDVVLYSVSKEKPVCHFIFNHVAQSLKDNGTLLLGGKKDQGVKSYGDKLKKQCGFTGTLKKQNDYYVGEFSIAQPAKNALDDKAYTQFRPCIMHEKSGLHFTSKPGLYGWNKIDTGSEFLIASFLTHHSKHTSLPESYIDLGCGYGFLTAQLAALGVLKNTRNVTVTDNNAAALTAVKLNCESVISEKSNADLHIIASNAGGELSGKFDLLLCNPPFHQGFNTSKDLTEVFVENASQLLSHTGFAYFVTNSFIGIEKIALHHFRKVEVIANNTQFKVIVMQQPT